jgi:hypothetical protein
MSPTRTAARRAPSRRRTTRGATVRKSSARRVSARPRRRTTPARPGRRPKKWAARWWPALLIAVAVVAGAAWHRETLPEPVPTPLPCTVAGVPLTAEQTGNAATIAAVARQRGLPDRAVVIALATAQQESRLRNLDYGDRDSLGLFQQRPSQGWGTPAQVQDPVYAAGTFYERLVRVPGWQTGRLTDVAQTVQRSGFPEAYQQWEPMALELTAALALGATPALPCR